jgi:hypothetical protein
MEEHLSDPVRNTCFTPAGAHPAGEAKRSSRREGMRKEESEIDVSRVGWGGH